MSLDLRSGSLQKRHVSRLAQNDYRDYESAYNEKQECSLPSHAESKLTLMEELLLLVMDPRGFISLWNDHVSRALRGCILIELWMRGKIELEPAGMKRKSFLRRMIIVKNASLTDDSLLNEALKLMKDSVRHTVSDWISYLSGETWNPLKLKYHMRHVRDRLFKDLVERGILSTTKTDYWVLDIKSHPVNDFNMVKVLRAKIKDALLERYSNDLSRIDSRTLSLLMLTQYSGRLGEALAGLPNDLERLANKRMQEIEGADFEAEGKRYNNTSIHWAVFAALNDLPVFL